MFGDTFGTLGARKRGRKRGGRKGRGSSCRVGMIRIRTRRGKVVQFRGKTGPGCAPRKKPSTRHLAPYKRKLASAARSCKGLSKKQFQSCVASAMHGKARRRRKRK